MIFLICYYIILQIVNKLNKINHIFIHYIYKYEYKYN